MNNKDIILLACIPTVIILIIALICKDQKEKKLELENMLLKKSINTAELEKKLLREDKLKIFQEYLKRSKEIPSEIKAQLEKLVSDYQSINPDVAKELIEILNLLENGMKTKAIAALAKIIENLLKDEFSKKMLEGKYSTDEEFQMKKRKISFYKVIEFAKENKFFADHEYSLMNLLRKFRNQECHQLAVEQPKNLITISFLTGIEIVFKLTGKKKTV